MSLGAGDKEGAKGRRLKSSGTSPFGSSRLLDHPDI